MLFPTTLVGSYPQPEWLIDRAKLAGRFPPRVRARELWRLEEPFLAQAQDDATLLAHLIGPTVALTSAGAGKQHALKPGCCNGHAAQSRSMAQGAGRR